MKKRSAQRARVAFLLWLLVAVLYFYFARDYVQAGMRAREFEDYLERIVGLAEEQERPANDIRSLALIKAEELSLPIGSENITIADRPDVLTVVVRYEVDVTVPILFDIVYRKEFEHRVAYPM